MTTGLVIGIGHPDRGDDAVGLLVAGRLDGALRPGWQARAHMGDLTALLDLWEDVEAVLVVDAMRSGAAPGTVRVVDPAAEPIPEGLAAASSHVVDLPEVLGLAETLGRRPAWLRIVAIEGARWGMGEGLSPAVEQALPVAHRAIRDQIEALAAAASGTGEKRCGLASRSAMSTGVSGGEK
jgi:hydrogenase maturation protease